MYEAISECLIFIEYIIRRRRQTLTGARKESAETVGRVLDQMLSLAFSFRLPMGQLGDRGQIPEGPSVHLSLKCAY